MGGGQGARTGGYGRRRRGVESWTPQKTKIKENNQKPKPKPNSQGQRNNLTRQARKRGGGQDLFCFLFFGLYHFFKKSNAGKYTRKKIEETDECFAQWAEKGSYRTATIIEYLKYILPIADHPRNSMVIYMDWFAAHLAEPVRNLIWMYGPILQKIIHTFRHRLEPSAQCVIESLAGAHGAHT